MTHEPARRLRGERGTAIITTTVLLFTFTFGAIIWLSRDVNRVVSNESAAQSIAFQAARAGAQQIATDTLRGGGADTVVLDAGAATAEAVRIGNRLLASYGLPGEVDDDDVAIDPSTATVTVTVTIDDPSGASTATGSAQATTDPP